MPPKRSKPAEKGDGEKPHLFHKAQKDSNFNPCKKEPKQKRARRSLAEEEEKKGKDKSAAEEKKEESSPSTSETEEITSRTATADGRSPNIKIASWNINGIRAWLKKDGVSYLKNEKPDILCVQEIKCDEDQIPKEAKVEGYYTYWYGGEKAGYAGTGIFSKKEPISIKKGLAVIKKCEDLYSIQKMKNAVLVYI